MARHNFALLVGVVRKPPVIRSNDFGVTAMCPLTVIRGSRDKNHRKVDRQAKYSTPILMSEEQTIVDEIATWNENDIVLITGFVATREVEKKAVCPECGFENYRRYACTGARSGGNRIYIHPIYAEKLKSFPEQGAAHKYLIEHSEISNRVFLLGNLTREPVKGGDDTKVYCRYQIAVDRKYCAEGMEEVRERTDYPWIYSYGQKAEIDFQALTTGALIYVDGALQTRKYKEVYTCQNPECGIQFEVPGQTLEVLSYDTEYLKNYDEKALPESELEIKE